MNSKKKKQIAGLLQRYQIIDFSLAVAKPRLERKNHLRGFVNRREGRWPSHKVFRSFVPDIVRVERGLDPSPPLQLNDIYKLMQVRCHKDDIAANQDLAKHFHAFMNARSYVAYNDHPRNLLKLAPDRSIPMHVLHYLVEDGTGKFQYVYTRRKQLSGDELSVLMSLVHYNYVRDDFEDFQVQVVDLSCPDETGPRGGVKSSSTRQPRVHTLGRNEIISREELNDEADTIYRYLMEITDEEG